MSESDETTENEETTTEETPEAVEEATSEEPEGASDGGEPVAQETAPEPEAEVETADEPSAEGAEDAPADGEDTSGDEPEADEEPLAEVPEEYREAADEAPADEGIEVDASEIVSLAAKTARVYLCECGYRTYAVWSEPTVCKNRPTRHGPECGKQLYPMDELPEQVQKALNPLKASKKRAAGAA